MSTADQAAEVEQTEVEAQPKPRLVPEEVRRARAEDPEFGVVLARARAKARGEAFDPDKHLVSEGRRKIDEATPGLEADISAIIGRFQQRGSRGRHLRAVDTKRAQANDT